MCDFLLVIDSYIGYYRSAILHLFDLLAKNCEFFLHHSHLTSSLGVNLCEFLDDFFIPKTRVLWLSVGEDFVILACVVFTQCQGVTDGDGRTDGHPDCSLYRACIARYADAL